MKVNYSIPSDIYTGSFKEITKTLITDQKKVLVLTSKSLERHHDIKSYFDGIDHVADLHVAVDVLPEVPFTYISRLYDAIDFWPDVIVAIGGGSVLDLAKAMSVHKTFDGLSAAFHDRNIPLHKEAEIIAVPTTFGTGAETSQGAILYDDTRGKKGGIRGSILKPDYVIIDSDLYKTAPKKIMAEAAYDCFAHSIETYISSASNPVARYQSVYAIETFFKYVVDAVIRDDDHAMLQMCLASMFMGTNLANSSTCLPHRIQYAVGPATDTSHAQGIIAIHKGWLAQLTETAPESYHMLLRDLRLSSDEFAHKVTETRQALQVDYTLRQLGVEDHMLDHIVASTTGNMQNDPIYKDSNTLKAIISKAI